MRTKKVASLKRLSPEQQWHNWTQYQLRGIKLAASISNLLGDKGVRSITIARKLCHDCPEKPNECGDCQADPNIAESLQEPIAIVVITEKEQGA